MKRILLIILLMVLTTSGQILGSLGLVDCNRVYGTCGFMENQTITEVNSSTYSLISNSTLYWSTEDCPAGEYVNATNGTHILCSTPIAVGDGDTNYWVINGDGINLNGSYDSLTLNRSLYINGSSIKFPAVDVTNGGEYALTLVNDNFQLEQLPLIVSFPPTDIIDANRSQINFLFDTNNIQIRPDNKIFTSNHIDLITNSDLSDFLRFSTDTNINYISPIGNNRILFNTSLNAMLLGLYPNRERNEHAYLIYYNKNLGGATGSQLAANQTLRLYVETVDNDAGKILFMTDDSSDAFGTCTRNNAPRAFSFGAGALYFRDCDSDAYENLYASSFNEASFQYKGTIEQAKNDLSEWINEEKHPIGFVNDGFIKEYNDYLDGKLSLNDTLEFDDSSLYTTDLGKSGKATAKLVLEQQKQIDLIQQEIDMLKALYLMNYPTATTTTLRGVSI